MEARDAAKTAILEKLNTIKTKATLDKTTDLQQDYIALEEAIELFKQSHLSYHAMLTNEDEQTISYQYYKEAEVLIKRLKEEIEELTKEQEDVRSVISRVSSKATSRASSTSSSKSKRLAATARKAALLAQAKQAERLKAVEEEELQLKARKNEEELRLKWKRDAINRQMEIAAIQAEEEVYARDEEEEERTQAQDDQSDKLKGCEDEILSTATKGGSTSSRGEPIIASKRDREEEGSCAATHMSNDHLLLNQKRMLDVMQAPPADICTFDGDPMQYYPFIRSFDNSVHETTLSDAAKLTRLARYVTDRPRAMVQSCMTMEPSAGYKKARELLQVRFGDHLSIMTAWVDKLTQGRRSGKQPAAQALQDYADDLRSCYETVSAMGPDMRAELNAKATLIQILHQLPRYLQNRWKHEACQLKRRKNRRPTYRDLMEFVEFAADEENDPMFGTQSKGDSYERRNPRAESFLAQGVGENNGPPRRPCPLCQQPHSLFYCNEFKTMTPSERLKFASEHSLCFNCLKPGHTSEDCRVDRTCAVDGCGQKHTKFLHQLTPQGVTPSVSANTSAVMMTLRETSTRIALPMIKVKLKHGDNEVEALALLDSGSTNSFCSRNIVQRLKLQERKININLSTLEKAESNITTSIVAMTVEDMEGKNSIHLPHVYTRSQIPIHSDNIATISDLKQYPHLRDLKLSANKGATVDLLIGQDAPLILTPRDVRMGGASEPYATKTLLGWTINGPLAKTSSQNPNKITSHFATLEQQLERFWHIDSNEILEPKSSIEDMKALEEWENSIQHKDGHYILNVPFKRAPEKLPINRTMVEQRTASLKKRLMKDEDLRNRYTENMNELIDKGHAEIVNANDKPAAWYLPHHPVQNPKKPEKTRIVFDCAAKTNCISLNDTVMQGPDLTNNLVGVLCRFREQPVAMMADIEQMFHQVQVTPGQDSVLRFLWWPNGDLTSDLVEYKMKVHLFGGRWSPSCCNFALKRTAKDFGAQYSELARSTINKNFYVDDCLKSVRSEEEACKLVKELTSLLAKGGFKLHKWVSNSRHVLKTIPTEARSKDIKPLELNQDQLPTERALGMFWDTQDDIFKFQVTLMNKPLTRRGLLSMISSIYDPLGLVSPVIIRAKKLVQDLTFEKAGWDEPLNEGKVQRWTEWIDGLADLKTYKIPRCVTTNRHNHIQHAELHHFSDASQMAYGAASYLRITDNSGSVTCTLMMSKAHLAPLKTMTIPRLELQAASVSVKLDQVLRKELDIKLGESTFWTDSQVVLQYIKSDQKRFHTFVANRVAAIRRVSNPVQWRHVNTKTNPADLLSRGMAANDLTTRKEWLQGPEFLHAEPQHWPQSYHEEPAEEDPEVKVTSTMTVTNHDPIQKLVDRYSDWMSLLRGIAWMLAIKGRLLGRREANKELTPEEIKIAEQEVLKWVQRKHFQEDINRLNSQRFPKTSKLYPLQPVINNGLLCVGSRLKHSTMPYLFRHPIILPKKDTVVSLLIKHHHESAGHAGREYVASMLREKYWIIGVREMIRHEMNRCTLCRRYESYPQTQIMSELPAERVVPSNPPFTDVGVDYFGPFLVKRGRSNEKRYGCLFTCFATRAIHIEVAHSLDTTSFINCLQRFVARRGMPKSIRSDNGTNFVGGERELREAWQEWRAGRIEKEMTKMGISWKFNPPAASHMGGIWERQIRTVRRILVKIAGTAKLTDEALATFMCLAESIVNNRPLTHVSSDPSDLSPITPNHLLLLRGVSSIPGDYDVKDCYVRRRWRHVQYLADVFWERWIKEYLPSLTQRSKWMVDNRNVAINDVVLVVDRSMPRNEWILGRVVKANKSDDGKVRSAEIRTKAGVIIRPIDKLCMLERELDNSDD